jgi:hypothetical protein
MLGTSFSAFDPKRHRSRSKAPPLLVSDMLVWRVASNSSDDLTDADMFAKLKAVWIRLSKGTGKIDESATALTEYNGYRIRPTPYEVNGQYQTAGIIEKDLPDGRKEHHFVRADTHQSRDDAINFTISKAKQIIDMQGDRIFM